LNIEQQEAITKDNAVILCTAITFVKVLDPVKASYGISNYRTAIQYLVMTNLRAIIGSMTLNEALSSRDHIKAKLKDQITNEVADWGLIVKSVEIQDIRPSDAMQTAMETQAGAERLKQAAVLQAEGKKQAAILEAEGKLEASRKEAEAQIILANASSEAIRQIRSAVGNEELPAYFLLADRYIDSIRKLSESPNTKTLLLPADFMAAVKGLIGK
jgi:regulator of protease activity HflC (stomatin/prohibitin superfamily)